MDSRAIVIDSLHKSFSDEVVIHDLDLDVEQGEFCVILGPSGCGKSTLLKCIAGLHDYDGEIHLNGSKASDISVKDRDLGFVFQEFEETLFPHMTVVENIAFGLELEGLPEDEIEDGVEEMLDLLAIHGTRDNYPNQLSGGQQQRVELARQLVRQCDVMLLDDPLADLDYKLQKRMELEMRRLHESLGSAFVYVTHNQDQALKLADKVVVMNKGQIEQIGSPAEVYYAPETAFVGRFVGDSNLLIAHGATADSGAVTVDTTIGPVTATSNGDGEVTSGGTPDAVVIIRPENISIGPDAETCDNRLTGTVEGRTYSGDFTEFDVSIESLEQHFLISKPGNVQIGSMGSDVQIGWDTEDARYLETISVTSVGSLGDLEEL